MSTRGTARAMAILLITGLVHLGRAEVFYVKADAGGANDGTSWGDAFVDLQDALLAVEAGDQVWVAAGRYVPRNVVDPTKPRLGTFSIPSGVVVYGGFVGDEATLADRVGLFEQTVLIGDVAGDDDPNFVNYDENVFHVVTFTETEAGTGLDGFLITAGNANAMYNARNMGGGGLRVELGRATVANTTFATNHAFVFGNKTGGGAGAYVYYGSIELDQCEFRFNLVESDAYFGIALGALGCQSSDLVITNSLLRDNFVNAIGQWSFFSGGAGIGAYNDPNTSANLLISESDFLDNVVEVVNGSGTGGAMAFESSDGPMAVRVESCLIARNEVRSFGEDRAVLNGGGILLDVSPPSPQDPVTLDIETCEITNNHIVNENSGGSSAASGGGFSSFAYDGALRLAIRNSVVRDNIVLHTGGGDVQGGGVAIEHFFTSGEVNIVNTRIAANQLVAIDHSRVRGGGLLLRNFGGLPRSSHRIVNSEIRGNVIVNWLNPAFPGGQGGGVFATGNAELEVHGALIAGNVARRVGGASLGSTRGVLVTDSTVAMNWSLEGAGGVGFDSIRDITLQNSLVWSNRSDEFDSADAQVRGPDDLVAVSYSNIEGWHDQFPGVGNIDADPLFVDPIGPDGIAGIDDGDYRLAGGSPCIDAGWNNAVPPDVFDLDSDGDTAEFTPLDLDGRARFADDPATPDTGCGIAPVVDMGAYEYSGDGSPPCVGDIDGDDVVSTVDLMVLLGAFGTTSVDAGWDCRADLNADLMVNISDLGAMLAVFGEGCE